MSNILAIQTFWAVVAGIVGLISLVFLLIIWRFFALWVRAVSSRAGVGMGSLIGMYLQRVDAWVIVDAKVNLVKSGIHDVATKELESHYLAGGNVPGVTRAVISANRAELNLDWRRACAIDLAGRDVVDAVNTSVNPKVIDVPAADRGKGTIDAVAMDGIQLKAKARVTVRTNISQLIGGAMEETIIARVGEGIVSAIGSAKTHKEVLENPDRISKAVLSKGLDSGTAFEILSIDIADIDVGDNIGAKLQADQAEADKRRFQAEAEKRRAMAIAQAAENAAKVEENRALVVLAESEVPKAIAESFRSGHLGIMDFYRLKNIQADTAMRSSISGERPERGGGQKP